MTEMSVVIPEEPPDDAVVLAGRSDHTGRRVAWQRRGRQWVAAATGFFGTAMPTLSLSWQHLVVDEGPLTLVHCPEPTAGEQGDGWRDAGFTDTGCQSFTEPSAVDAPADGWRQAGYDDPACRSLAQTA